MLAYGGLLNLEKHMKHREMNVSNCNDWTTHTPGPWVIGTGVDCDRIYSDGGNGILVATLDPAQFEEEVAMKAADARLIAAAPDLVLALQAMLCQFQERVIIVDEADAAAINIARAAIAKTESGGAA